MQFWCNSIAICPIWPSTFPILVAQVPKNICSLNWFPFFDLPAKWALCVCLSMRLFGLSIPWPGPAGRIDFLPIDSCLFVHLRRDSGHMLMFSRLCVAWPFQRFPLCLLRIPLLACSFAFLTPFKLKTTNNKTFFSLGSRILFGFLCVQ